MCRAILLTITYLKDMTENILVLYAHIRMEICSHLISQTLKKIYIARTWKCKCLVPPKNGEIRRKEIHMQLYGWFYFNVKIIFKYNYFQRARRSMTNVPHNLNARQIQSQIDLVQDKPSKEKSNAWRQQLQIAPRSETRKRNFGNFSTSNLEENFSNWGFSYWKAGSPIDSQGMPPLVLS